MPSLRIQLQKLLARLGRSRAPIRVLIVDDDHKFAAALEEYLRGHESLEVVGIAEDGGDAIDLTLIHHPDVVVMDALMPVVGGVDATAHLRAIRAAARIILMSGDREAASAAATAGAVAYLPKADIHDRLVDIIEAVGSADDRRTFRR
jgi:DNA-binding NarL/FixJ family response regulator